MDRDYEAQALNFISGLILGAVIGAGIALLAAPDTGRRTRRRIRRAAVDARETATDRWEDLSGEVREKVDDAVRGARRRLGD